MQRLALPHILASEPSALKMRMLKSALPDEPISTSPSLPMPVWGRLHATASSSGFGTASSSGFGRGYIRVLT